MAEFTFKVTVNSVRISILCSIIAIGSYLYFVKDKKIQDTINFIVQTIGVSAGVVSVIYAGENIQRASKIKEEDEQLRKTDRALNYISLWNNPNFYIVRDVSTKIKEIIYSDENKNKKDEHPKLANEALSKDKDLEQKLIDILNFLEEVSMAVNKQLINEDIIKDFFVHIFERYAQIYNDYINEQRRLKEYEQMYINFTTLNSKWRNSNH